MKRILFPLTLLLIIGNIWALDINSSVFKTEILTITKPGPPLLFQDGVIFTAPSTFRSVGIAFENEGFNQVHWFLKLMANIENTAPFNPDSKKPRKFQKDSGVLFYAWTAPENLRLVKYRLIMDGVWGPDPRNPRSEIDPTSGLQVSVVEIPPRPPAQKLVPKSNGFLEFHFKGDPGQSVTVAGDFNNWDPFMYKMTEGTPGQYTITLRVPAGSWHYIFYYKGESVLDPQNFNRVVMKDNKPVCVAVVK
jgi:hypothetical protein